MANRLCALTALAVSPHPSLSPPSGARAIGLDERQCGRETIVLWITWARRDSWDFLIAEEGDEVGELVEGEVAGGLRRA